jgi:hypothetical protein
MLTNVFDALYSTAMVTVEGLKAVSMLLQSRCFGRKKYKEHKTQKEHITTQPAELANATGQSSYG